jgi:Sigma 54 modulation protein / S30EA ribosomal protein
MRLSSIVTTSTFVVAATACFAVSTTCAFTSPAVTFVRPTAAASSSSSSRCYMSLEQQQSIPIVVTGNNIDLTEALENYVKQKLERPLDKIGTSGLTHGVSCDVHLVVNKNPKVCVWYVCWKKKGSIHSPLVGSCRRILRGCQPRKKSFLFTVQHSTHLFLTSLFSCFSLFLVIMCILLLLLL